MKLTDEALLREAKRGAVLSLDGSGAIWHRGVLIWRDCRDDVVADDDAMSDRWEIAEPAPGACQRCKGTRHVDYRDEGYQGEGDPLTTCPRCGGTGEEPKVCDWCKGTGKAVNPGTGKLETCICGGSGRDPESEIANRDTPGLMPTARRGHGPRRDLINRNCSREL